MEQQQSITRVRRQYNQWVANQMLEDYALRFTAKSSRKWSHFWVANTAIGSISFLALEAIGGTLTLSYGFQNAASAIVIVGLIIFLASMPISYYAAKYGVDIDLLTRGAGFGYIGSTITSLIYASFTFIFFALEAAIMSLALNLCFGLPLEIGYLLNAIIVIPVVTLGITLISRFQMWTQPLWIILHILPFAFIIYAGAFDIEQWTSFKGRQNENDGGLNLLMFGAASAVIFSLIAQIGEQVDFLRFLKSEEKSLTKTGWWLALISAGPGWIVLGVIKMLAGSFLVVLALNYGIPDDRAAEPTQMYLVAFSQVISNPEVALALTGLFVIISQLKINVTNAYAGSIAWSNFFSRLTHSHPGRVVWLVFNVVIAVLLMMFGIFEAFEHTLGLYANVAVAWVGAIVADLIINKPLGLSPPHIEFKRAHLYDINPVGVGSMGIASLLSILAYIGVFGNTAQALSSFIALGTAMIIAPIIAYATKGKYYIAREPVIPGDAGSISKCCICEHNIEKEDITYCPIYAGNICSLCCSLDARCFDGCKTDARLGDQFNNLISHFLSPEVTKYMSSHLGRFFGVLFLMSSIIAVSFSLIYFQITLDATVPKALVFDILIKAFAVLFVIVGVASWLFVLAHQSRVVALDESSRQTNLLLREIRAHERTDRELQRAKEVAEAASHAKSKYIIGISHELRTPLNAILGYAQLLENDPAVPGHRLEAVRVIKRSSEHLSGLVEGLLDISKIEVGRLELYRDKIILPQFLEQLVSIFKIQAEAKSIKFIVEIKDPVPDFVHTDEKRLRQILINLLSNSIKFTDKGHVKLRFSYRNEVAKIVVEDTGRGIKNEHMEKIFKPFERIHVPNKPQAPGTGLGLTITKLLTEVMGGELTVTSQYGKGSCFTIRMMLPKAHEKNINTRKTSRITGYTGQPKRILIADDNMSHRQLLNDILSPLGFIIFESIDARSCLSTAARCEPDLFLLDVSMPEIDGWQLAKELRENGFTSTPIIMVSANAGDQKSNNPGAIYHDGFIAKPFRIDDLLERIQKLLKLEWTTSVPHADEQIAIIDLLRHGERPTQQQIEELRHLSQIGYVRGIKKKLSEIRNTNPELKQFTKELDKLVVAFELSEFDNILEAIQSENTI